MIRLVKVAVVLCASVCLEPVLVAATPPAELVQVADLFKAKEYAKARAILVPLVAREPGNPDAAYFLGMCFLRDGGPKGLDSARDWLGKAVKLAPGNSDYLGEYAGVCLLMANRDNSFSLALEGRDAMTRAIEANADDLEARDGLVQFYAKAPWPLGSAEKALAMAAEIARRDIKAGEASYRGAAAIFSNQGRQAEAKSALHEAQILAAGPGH